MTVSVSNSKPFCVYQHSSAEVVFYVGSGSSARPFETYGRTTRWKDHVKRAGGYEVSIVAWFDTVEEARQHESKLISSIKPCVNVMGLRRGFSGQTCIRVPEDLHERILELAGKRGRSKWILEACRMRLDRLPKASAGDQQRGDMGQTIQRGAYNESITKGPQTSDPPATKDGNVAQTDRAPTAVRLEEVAGSNPAVSTKPNMQALRDICSGRRVTVPVLSADDPMPQFREVEIPICGKSWWEDGEHYECLMDKGHRESLAGKHGLRGMVRRLNA